MEKEQKDFARNHPQFMQALNSHAMRLGEISDGEMTVITTALRRANSGNTVRMLTTFAEKTSEHSKNPEEVEGAHILMQLLQNYAKEA